MPNSWQLKFTAAYPCTVLQLTVKKTISKQSAYKNMSVKNIFIGEWFKYSLHLFDQFKYLSNDNSTDASLIFQSLII